MTLVVNLYGGPGTGKSTNAALLFGKLKAAKVNCEIAHEYAKDLTWEQRHHALGFQPYVMGKQIWRVQRLIDQVDIVITDSPILMSIVYSDLSGYQPTILEFKDFLRAVHRSWNTLDIFLARDNNIHPYSPKGRNQTLADALALDDSIRQMLVNEITTKRRKDQRDFIRVPVLQGDLTADILFSEVMKWT